MAVEAEAYVLLGQVVGAGVVVGTPLVGALVWLNKRFEKKADKHSVNNSVQEVKTELAVHRTTTREDIRALYQNAEADRKTVRDGFEKLSAEIHETHIALLNRIDGK